MSGNITTIAPDDDSPNVAAWVPYYVETLVAISLVAAIVTVILFILYRRVFYGSLNVIWVGGALGFSILHSLAHLISGIEWIRVSSVGRQGVYYCTLRVIADGVFLTAVSLFLFIYYAHIQVIKRKDEARAMSHVKYYFGVVVALSVALLVFLVIEVPKDYTSSDDTCVSAMSASSHTIMFLLPLALEVLCVFGAGAIVLRLATVSSSKGPMIGHLVFLSLMIVIRATTFIGSVTLSRGTQTRTNMFIVDRSFTALIGLLLSALFVFSERVPLITQLPWSAYDDTDDINGINGSQNHDDHDERSVTHSTSPSRASKSPPRMTSNLDTMMNPTTSLLESTKTNSNLEEYHKTSLSGAARNATDIPTGEIPF